MDKCKHGNAICAQCVKVTDVAKKIADTINLQVAFKTPEELSHGWMAFSLAEGNTDWAIYPSKAEAIAHQSNEFLYLYIAMGRCLAGVNAKDMQLFLDMHRHAYANGMRLADPKAPDIIMPLSRRFTW